MNKVHIVYSSQAYVVMFVENGWEVVDTIEEADLVQFTGGADVFPGLYREPIHPKTGVLHERDHEDIAAYFEAEAEDKPMAGICRGGQFLNVMCGGKLYQHVTNHAISGTHDMTIVGSRDVIPVTSTHHQMMRAGKRGEVLGNANQDSVCEYVLPSGDIHIEARLHEADTEVVLYRDVGALCFQPHPEYMGKDSPCQEWYFQLIERILL